MDLVCSHLCAVHVIGQVSKGHLGLYHPELCQMPGSVAVLCPECWPCAIHQWLFVILITAFSCPVGVLQATVIKLPILTLLSLFLLLSANV